MRYSQQVPGKLSYKDPSLPVEQRLNDLLERMTLEEKVAQLGSVHATDIVSKGRLSINRASRLLGSGIGQISRVAGRAGANLRQASQIIRDLQDFLLHRTRLGIPAIVHEECLSGLMARGATTFPQAIGLASTWDPELVRSVASVIRRQMRALGAVQGLAPVLDVARDPRWGRVEETLGEDPYLVACLGAAYIQGLQGSNLTVGVAATPKHFAAHSFSEGGRNRAPVHVGPREFREIFLFPFEAAIKNAKACSVMNAYHEVDGIPCAADRLLFTELLRDEWGFKGFVVSDYNSVEELEWFHRVAADKKQAAVLALEAGIDVELPRVDCYGEPLLEAFREGLISEATIDGAVCRILRAKFELGLFDKPFTGASVSLRSFNTSKDKALARRAARDSIVLLKNDGILPLKKNLKAFAVVGPNANSASSLFGDYAYFAHLQVNPVGVKTVLEAIREKVSGETRIHYARACGLTGRSRRGFRSALRAAEESDVVIAVLGERSGSSARDISGEGNDRASLALPGEQENLVMELAMSGKPVVIVLLNGRPLSTRRVLSHCNALIEAWFPGGDGGAAVADVLFGNSNPGGKLPISFPGGAGEIPVHYNRKPSAFGPYVRTDSKTPYREKAKAPFPFGYGLSYTKFRYSALSITPAKCAPAGKVTVKFRVANTGGRRGDEVVQMYMCDEVASVTRPFKELKGFVRLTLDAGEEKSVLFRLRAEQLAFYNRKMKLVVEPGVFKVMVGSSSENIRLTGSFEIAGQTKVVTLRGSFFSEAVCGVKDHRGSGTYLPSMREHKHSAF